MIKLALVTDLEREKREREMAFRERNSHFVAKGRDGLVNKFEGGKDFREKLVSVFIGNLNPIVDSMGLWGIFKVFGR